jgi:predicted alpha/beta-fold hydrolase
MIVPSEFTPAKGLKNANLQTLWPFVARLRVHPKLQRERVELSDGDFIDLEWAGEGDGPIIILLHGMTGNIDSPYIKGMLQSIAAQGWRGVMMYYRGCSEEINRLPVTYHFGRSDDFDSVLRHIQNKHPQTPLHAVGYSMGGNVLLKWLGEHPEENILQSAAAVSPPFDLRSCSANIRKGLGRFYQWYIMREVRHYLRRKYSYPDSPIDLKKVIATKSFWDLDEKVTAPINGFPDALTYYQSSSCKSWLKHITTNTLIIHAQDDPLIPSDSYPSCDKLSKKIRFEISRHGGHVGFIGGSISQPEFWLDQRILKFFTEQKNTPHSSKLNKVNSCQEYA